MSLLRAAWVVAAFLPSFAQAQSDDILDDLGDEPAKPAAEAAPEEAEPAESAEPVAEPTPAAPATVTATPTSAMPSPAGVAAPTDASDPRSLDRVKAVQRRSVLKVRRVELTPLFGVSVNDAFFTHLGVGGAGWFYPHDSLGFGVSGLYLFGHPRSDNHDVVRRGQTAVLATLELPDAFATADIVWHPIYGKISLFGRGIVHFDLYAVSGFGVAWAGGRKPVTFAPGIGQRFMIADWLALRFDVRDYIYLDTAEVNNQPRSDLQNYVMFNVGVSVFVPPSFQYNN